MTAPCGATTRDVHGDAVCDLDAGHRGGHSGEVMSGICLSWSAAPPLSPREREIVDRFEAAPDPYRLDHEPFVAERGHYGWHYAGGAVEHVERHNCSKGCAVPNPNDVAEHGPGGCCDLLALLFTGDPIREFEDTGTHVLCHVRQVPT